MDGNRKGNAGDDVVFCFSIAGIDGHTADWRFYQQMVSHLRGIAFGNWYIFLAGTRGFAGERIVDGRVFASHCHERLFPGGGL